jgi:hypothetical protein
MRPVSSVAKAAVPVRAITSSGSMTSEDLLGRVNRSP